MRPRTIDRGPLAATFQTAALLLVLLGVVAIFVDSTKSGARDAPAKAKPAPTASIDIGTTEPATKLPFVPASHFQARGADVSTGKAPGGHPPASFAGIAELTLDSDFTVYMRQDVSEDARRAALRKLWTLMDLPVSCMELCI